MISIKINGTQSDAGIVLEAFSKDLSVELDFVCLHVSVVLPFMTGCVFIHVQGCKLLQKDSSLHPVIRQPSQNRRVLVTCQSGRVDKRRRI